MNDLPIHRVLPDLLSALDRANGAVLIAPPGAGKTTAIAPRLIEQAWCPGLVILLSPRRVAARAAAERMAQTIGEKPGETIGYLTRLDSKRSSSTRVLVMTEAIFVATILDDPGLANVSAVVFDEAHERHIDSDLGLALAIEARDALRPDLRILVMSATLDGDRFAALLGPATPVIESAGKAWPLEIRWLGASPEMRVDEAVAAAVRTAWREQTSDILAFLPGVGEIERVRERLAETLPAALVLPLHGQCDPAAQRAAIQSDPQGRRRIVLATAIAETSLTLNGVSVVVDAGLARRAEFDKAAGVTRLVTHRASQASAAQRAGRAARQGPGVAYRMWEEAAHPGRSAFEPPEMLTADLAPLVLNLARWGTRDPATMAWIEPPPAAAVDTARTTLETLGALDAQGAISDFGRAVAELPMEPAHAATVLFGARAGREKDAAEVILLLQERGLGGRGEDLLARLDRWRGDRSSRAQASRALAARWAQRAAKLVERSGNGNVPENPGSFLARARPDMIARRRDANGEHWLSAGGRGYTLDPASPLARSEWLVIGDAQGTAKGARITAAAPLEMRDIEGLADLVEQRTVLDWNDAAARVEPRRQRRLGAIVLASGPDPHPDSEAVRTFLLERALENWERIVPAPLLARGRHAGIARLSENTLRAESEEWLAPVLTGRRDLELPAHAVIEAILARLTWDERQTLDRLAPREFISPAGTRHAIDYADEAGPSVEVRAQALFGLDRHPTIGADTPLLLKLTSPAGRPLQATRDLPGFWRGSWKDVQRDMKGRYPRHRWPDEPWNEDPSLKTKNAFEGRKRS